jgi:hypothetical protein
MLKSSPELAQLRDIHLPEAIGWWPLAPGWYLLGLFLLTLGVLGGLVTYRRYAHGRAKREAQHLLKCYQQQYQQQANSQLFSAKISELLKRVALVYYPREQVASLQGEAWITFLNNTAKGVDFYCVREALLELPYQPSKKYDLQSLFKLAQAWIKRQRGQPCLN